jgi:hypothetical protein
MRRCEEDPAVAIHEVAAGRLAGAIRDAAKTRTIDVHGVLLIAGAAIASGLKDQSASVGAEIRFRVLAAAGQLADRAEVFLTGPRRNRNNRNDVGGRYAMTARRRKDRGGGS